MLSLNVSFDVFFLFKILLQKQHIVCFGLYLSIFLLLVEMLSIGLADTIF